MLSNNLHIFPAQGFRPAVRVSFKDEYSGWIGFKDEAFYFRFKGQYLCFYLKQWCDKKQETILIKQQDQCVSSAVRSLLLQARKSLFKANIDIKTHTILGRPYEIDGQSIKLFSLKKCNFIPLKESSLFTDVILESHYATVKNMKQAQFDDALASLFCVS